MLFSLIVMLGKFLQAWNAITLDACPIIPSSCLVEASPGFFKTSLDALLGSGLDLTEFFPKQHHCFLGSMLQVSLV